MIFSDRTLKIEEVELYRIFKEANRLKALGRDIYSLGVGEPYQQTPDIIKEAGIQAIKEGRTGYIPVIGSLELRTAIAKKHFVDLDEVFVSHGAKTVLSLVLECLINKDDIVFIPTPHYPPFVECTNFLDGIHVLINTKSDGFRLTAAMVEKTIKELGRIPKVLLVNSPNNPTGVEYDKKELAAIARLAEKHDFYVVADECYSNFSSDKDFTMRKLSENVIAVNSFSKSHAMTGWRIGWALGPKNLIKDAIAKIANNKIGCPNAIADFAARTAVVTPGLPDYTEQRQMMREWLANMKLGFDIDKAGIYVFRDFSGYIEKGGFTDATELAYALLEKTGVVTIPGVSFGKEFKNYLRISYSVAPGTLKKGLALLAEEFLKM